MADEFNRLLASAIAPPDRGPDRHFVAAVQARILIEDRMAAERWALVVNLIKQLLALLAVTASVLVITRAEPVESWLVQDPAMGLGILLAVFAFAVALLGWRPGPHGTAAV